MLIYASFLSSLLIIKKGEDCVWVKPISTKNNGEYDVPFAAKIQSTDKDRLLVTDDDGKEFWITKNQVSFILRSTQSTCMKINIHI